jgi:anti-sigma B factor antagonist
MSANAPELSPAGLTLRTYTRVEGTVVQCAGRLTAEHSAALKAHVKSLMPGAKRIILDLKDVTRMDSSGLGAVVGLYVSARKERCEFLLVNYNKSIKDLLGVTNLLSVFEACAQSGMRIP